MAPRTTLIIFFIYFSCLAGLGCGNSRGRVGITTPNVSISSDSQGTQAVVKLPGGKSKIVLNGGAAANPAVP
ncbi:MAG: hypothetical protein ACE5G9_08585 [Nitrospinales bacterium]